MHIKIFEIFCSLVAMLLVLATVSPLILLMIVRVFFWGAKGIPQNAGVNQKLHFWKKLLLGIAGGFIAEIVAIAVYSPAEARWCREMAARGSYCDGQGVLILIFTVPLGAILGSFISLLWTWCSLRIPASSPWASVFTYSGKNRALHLGLALAIQIAYWSIFTLAAYLQACDLLLGPAA